MFCIFFAREGGSLHFKARGFSPVFPFLSHRSRPILPGLRGKIASAIRDYLLIKRGNTLFLPHCPKEYAAVGDYQQADKRQGKLLKPGRQCAEQWHPLDPGSNAERYRQQ